MSFENKGFPNDLNNRFQSMNRQNFDLTTFAENVKSGKVDKYVKDEKTKKAAKEIKTPDNDLPIDNVTGRKDLTANTNLPEFTITSKKDSSKYIYITLAIIIIAVLLYLKFKKK